MEDLNDNMIINDDDTDGNLFPNFLIPMMTVILFLPGKRSLSMKMEPWSSLTKTMTELRIILILRIKSCL